MKYIDESKAALSTGKIMQATNVNHICNSKFLISVFKKAKRKR